MACAGLTYWRAEGFGAPIIFYGVAAAGLLVPRSRGWTAWSIMAVVTYRLSALHRAGSLDLAALWYIPVAAAVLFIGWPRLIQVKSS